IHQHLDAYLSACQLGITLASFGLGWIGEPAFTRLLEPLFTILNIQSLHVIEIVSFLIAFSLLSFLHIVVGELMPKSMAIRQSERVSIWTAVPLYAFYWIMYPAIWVLNGCSNYLLKVSGLDETHNQENFYSTDEIKLILSASHLHGELTKDETEILGHTLHFADLKVTEVMRPREEMVVLNVDQPTDDILRVITDTRYSRYPVFDKKQNAIIGIIHVKDFFAALYRDKTIDNIEKYIRPVLKVPSRTPSLDLLRKFREGMPHFALVHRGDKILGFVTLDNLLHVLIGRIKDEFHRTQDDWVVNEDGTFIVKGDCPIVSLERLLDVEIEIILEDEDERAEILADLILNNLTRLPIEDEHIEFKEFTAVVVKMSGPRIKRVKIIPRTSDE
ncbi:MAG: hemolysin family protein, partial [Pseudomonadota bacterium]|nr:hemolysin family protein [Pseudomonadota bacterium]